MNKTLGQILFEQETANNPLLRSLAAWHDLSPETKKEWEERASRAKHIPVVHLFKAIDEAGVALLRQYGPDERIGIALASFVRVMTDDLGLTKEREEHLEERRIKLMEELKNYPDFLQIFKPLLSKLSGGDQS